MLTSRVEVRRAGERGLTRTDWLESWHSFSFGGYFDPRHMGLGPLRVLNDDTVAPGKGFGPHAHRDMDIVTYVLAGAVEHRDSAGNHAVIRAGDAQFLRAGTGVVHSEMNASTEAPVRFLQVWFLPRTLALAPAYDQRRVEFPARGGWAPLASGNGMGGIEIDSDAALLAARIPQGGRAGHVVHGGRMAYVFVAEGEVQLAGETLQKGDAALVRDGVAGVRGVAGSHVLLFDLPLA